MTVPQKLVIVVLLIMLLKVNMILVNNQVLMVNMTVLKGEVFTFIMVIVQTLK